MTRAEEIQLLEDIAYYESVLKRGNMDAKSIATHKAMKKTNLEKLISKKHKNAICGGKNGTRYHTRVAGNRQLFAPTLDGLYEKLYLYYYGEHTYTLGQLFEPYTIWKQEHRHLTAESVRRERDFFRRYVEGSPLASMKIVDIKASDIESFFTSYAEQLKRHALGNIKSILNGIFDYAVVRDIVPYNVSRQYNTRAIKTIAETSNYNVFTDDDRNRILNVLSDSDNVYDLAIQFMFCLCCRIGEIRALHWEDITPEDEFVIIRREIVVRTDENGQGHFVEVNHTKTGHDSGVRRIPLNDRAKLILQKVRTLSKRDTVYIFTGRGGKHLYETPFGAHLRAACKKAGVIYRSSHKIRFWAASALAANGASVQEMMQIGGWSDKETALRYIRMNTDGNRVKSLVCGALN